ncbi:MAG: ATP-binding cassette domain-containing protein [Tissierellia bacterium]|nr:ATP-binding cassette domain-containing protein [Tissierellia bacterium]
MNHLQKEHQKLLDEKQVLLEVDDLKKYFRVGKGLDLKAVDGISFKIYKGETFGLVGESGCGKTTVGRTVLRIYDPTDGTVKFKGQDIKEIKNRKDVQEFKGNAQMIFQDPYSSLDPRMTIGDIIQEGLDVHFPKMTTEEKHARISHLLEIVGLNPEHGARFPHELSGGQRQRIGIARALALEPDFIVCDEPISALDVSIQAQIVNLLNYLQWEMGLTYLFISHDLSMVQHISDRIGVMYLGHLVELTDNKKLYNKPLHPYTQALISAIPVVDLDIEKKERIHLEGEVPSPINPPKGCPFAPRCRECMDICKSKKPQFKEVEEDHWVACHLY